MALSNDLRELASLWRNPPGEPRPEDGRPMKRTPGSTDEPPRRRRLRQAEEHPRCGDRGHGGTAWPTRAPPHQVRPHATLPAGRSSERRPQRRRPPGAGRTVADARWPMCTRSRSPTTRPSPDRSRRVFASTRSSLPARARGPRQSCPRTSPPFPALVKKRIEHARRLPRLRQLLHDQGSRWRGCRQPESPTPFQPRQPAFRIFGGTRESRHQTCHRSPTVRDDDRLAVPYAIDQGAELILRFSYCGFLHVARIAT